jgi:cystathionine beta-lyase/cystathionine gamma-synthase
MHSLTKYMNGHTDVVMGAIMLNDEELYKRLKYLQNAVGAVPSPFDCFLVNRGIKTLAIRMRQHMENGMKVARTLEQNPRISKVIYPGYSSYSSYSSSYSSSSSTFSLPYSNLSHNHECFWLNEKASSLIRSMSCTSDK